MLENECRPTNFAGYRRNPNTSRRAENIPQLSGKAALQSQIPRHASAYLRGRVSRARVPRAEDSVHGMPAPVSGEAAEIDRIGLHNVYPANKWRGTVFAHSALQLLLFFFSFLAFSFRMSHIPQTAVRNLVCPTAPASSFFSFSPATCTSPGGSMEKKGIEVVPSLGDDR